MQSFENMTDGPTAMPSHCYKFGLRKLVLTIWLAALIQAFAQPVRAEVRVTGQADALTVEAHEASVEEVLAALRTSFNLQIQTSGVPNHVITGTYSGSLQRVVARLLDGQNYVMRSFTDHVEIVVIGPGASGGASAAWERAAGSSAMRPELLAPPPSSGGEGWNGNLDAAPPGAPAAKKNTGVGPGVSPPAVSVPVPTPTKSVPAAANSVSAPGPASPQPVPVPLIGQPGVEGWNG